MLMLLINFMGINKRHVKIILVISFSDEPSGLCGISIAFSPKRPRAPAEPSLCLLDKKEKDGSFKEVRTVLIT